MVDKNHEDTPKINDDLSSTVDTVVTREEEDSGATSDVSSEENKTGINDQVPVVRLEDEMKQSFIDYAMSVIVDRALPDVRDGLKPVHRRVLYDMYDLKIWHNGPTKKSARIVGDVIGRFHPHGDAAVYETIVRMAQWFSMRAPLIFGQGNFGNLDGDGAAAMRYTEVRMTKIAEMLLQDLDKETVNTYPNYDGNEQIPEVLPARFPNLLVNGSSGIAVGLATNIPPHNLAEVIDGTLALLKNPNLTLDEVMQYIPGPDFPTGGLIVMNEGIKQAYATGRGRCVIRARTHTDTDKQGRKTIYVDEIPYMVNKSSIVKEIVELVREKKIEGIAEVNDLSDKDNQVRIAIDLKRDAYEEAVLNNLFQHTSMQSSFSFNVIALVNNRPQQLSLLEILREFIKFRREVVTRRTVYLLRQDRRKAFLDEGLMIAKNNIQHIVDLITGAANAEEARHKLAETSWDGKELSKLIEYDCNGDNICLPIGIEGECGLSESHENYHLSEVQIKAILALQLSKLTHLASEEIQADYQHLKENIKGYLEILNSTERMNEVIEAELLEAKNTFKDNRRSDFVYVDGYISKADLIAKQDVLITLSHEGYIKYQDLSWFESRSRGSVGNSIAKLKDEDYIVTSAVCNNHDSVLGFTNFGRCFVTPVYDLPTSTNKTWRGRPVQNLCELQEGEQVKRLLPLKDIEQEGFLVFATKKGGIKRTSLDAFRSFLRRSNSLGIKSINLDEGDELVTVEISSGEDDILLFSSNGRCLRFCEANNNSNADESEDMVETEVDSDTDSAESEDENGNESDRINAELLNFQRYESVRRSGDGVRARSRTAGTVRGMMLTDGAVISGMIVVPASDLENPDLNYLMITDKGTGKRGRLISIVGKLHRGSRGILMCSRVAREENIVSVILVHGNADYLAFSNDGTIVRSPVSDLLARSRSAGFLTLKRLREGEEIIGLQEIAPEVVESLNETAAARAAEKRDAAAEAEALAQAAEDRAQALAADADLDFDDTKEVETDGNDDI